jgi:hypothetical protein
MKTGWTEKELQKRFRMRKKDAVKTNENKIKTLQE